LEQDKTGILELSMFNNSFLVFLDYRLSIDARACSADKTFKTVAMSLAKITGILIFQ
jgi:hypothetical protein